MEVEHYEIQMLNLLEESVPEITMSKVVALEVWPQTGASS